MAEREVLRDAIGVGRVKNRTLAEAAAALGIFALQQMAFAGVAAQDFARAGDLEPFGHGLSCFDAFGSSHKFNSIAKGRALYAAGRDDASVIFPVGTCLEKIPTRARRLHGFASGGGVVWVAAGLATSMGAPALSWARTASVKSESPLL